MKDVLQSANEFLPFWAWGLIIVATSVGIYLDRRQKQVDEASQHRAKDTI